MMSINLFFGICLGLVVFSLFLGLVFTLVDRHQPGFWPALVNRLVVAMLLLVALGSMAVGWWRFGVSQG